MTGKTKIITVSKSQLMRCVRRAKTVVEQWPEWGVNAFAKYRPKRGQKKP